MILNTFTLSFTLNISCIEFVIKACFIFRPPIVTLSLSPLIYVFHQFISTGELSIANWLVITPTAFIVQVIYWD